MTFIKRFESTVAFAQKEENLICVFTKQLFINVLLKNIA